MERQQDFGYYENQPHHKTSMTVSKLKNRSSTIGHLPYFLVGSSWIHCCGRYHIERFKVDLRFPRGSIYGSGNTFTLNTNTIILFAFIIVMAFILSAAIIVFARLAPKAFIVTGVILNVVLGIGTAIFYFVEKYYSAAIVFLIFALFGAWCYWSSRHRIPLSATILTIVIDVMKMYPSTLIASFIGLIFSAAFSALFSIVIVATYVSMTLTATTKLVLWAGQLFQR